MDRETRTHQSSVALGTCLNSPLPAGIRALLGRDVPALTTPELGRFPRPAVVVGSRPCERFASAVAADPALAYVMVTDTPASEPDDWVDAVVVHPSGISAIVRAAEEALERKREQHRPRAIVSDSAFAWRGTIVPISQLESRILRCLLDMRGNVVTRERLARELWGEYANDPGRAVDAHVYRLRKRIDLMPGVSIETMRQRGFRLRLCDGTREEMAPAIPLIAG